MTWPSTTDELYDRDKGASFYEERYQAGYMEAFWPEWKKRRILEVVRGLGLPAEGDALDFGCGNGVFTEVLRGALPSWRACGMEVSETALSQARERYPRCTFFARTDPALIDRRFDLLFTHHVLEHMHDIEQLWGEMALLVNPGGRMLHVLPCANPGSFEHRIVELRKDGADGGREGRWYMEDVGHLRRLDTTRMDQLAAAHGFTLAAELYANQFWGGVELLTASGRAYVSEVIDPSRGRDPGARRRLRAAKFALGTLAQLRSWSAPPSSYAARVPHALSRRAKDLVKWMAFPLCLATERFILARIEHEWRHRNTERAGSEMYLCYRRQPAVDRS